MVFLGTSGFIYELKQLGWIGVDLFFALSAFLLTRNLIAEYKETNRIDRIAFIVKRSKRILPLYITYATVVIATAILILEHPINVLRIIGIYAFFDNVLSGMMGFNPMWLTGHLWSISYEVQCYILLGVLMPILFSTSKNFKLIVVLGILLVSFSVKTYLKVNDFSYALVYVLPITHIDSFLMGCLLAFLHHPLSKRSYLLFSVASFVCLLLILTQYSRDEYIFIYTLTGIFIGWIIYTVLFCRNRILDHILLNSSLRYLGKISYGLYIFHLIGNEIGLKFYDYKIEGNELMINLISLIFTILISSLSYECFEKFFLKNSQHLKSVDTKKVLQ
jgi:peptidoglycan/LPS O-acetylase OafA/YrhL